MGSGVAPFPDPEDSWGEVAFQWDMFVQKEQGADLIRADLQKVDTSNEPGWTPGYQGALYNQPKWSHYFFFGGRP
jgi:hypothetical protein